MCENIYHCTNYHIYIYIYYLICLTLIHSCFTKLTVLPAWVTVCCFRCNPLMRYHQPNMFCSNDHNYFSYFNLKLFYKIGHIFWHKLIRYFYRGKCTWGLIKLKHYEFSLATLTNVINDYIILTYMFPGLKMNDQDLPDADIDLHTIQT